MSETGDQHEPDTKPLRRGWTTGACATAATKSALGALLGAGFADPVTITLPGGQQPGFTLAHEATGEGFAEAGIIKDAGDDPDVTHGALVMARVEQGVAGERRDLQGRRAASARSPSRACRCRSASRRSIPCRGR